MIRTAPVDLVYQAIAHQTRREIITFLREGPKAASEIAARFSVSQAAISQHLRILLKASLLHVETIGRKRLYSSNPSSLEAVRSWIARVVASPARSLILMPPRPKPDALAIGWRGPDPAGQ
ncbi:MAG: winged helix-turn-helix transcriptional regulator [Acidobacteriota bacterium]|nr:winged helix-turn-helix transcriptional regulator [Acidobacteriota bacterium]